MNKMPNVRTPRKIKTSANFRVSKINTGTIINPTSNIANGSIKTGRLVEVNKVDNEITITTPNKQVVTPNLNS